MDKNFNAARDSEIEKRFNDIQMESNFTSCSKNISFIQEDHDSSIAINL